MTERVRKRWSLLVYIAGDNNLSDAGLDDIREMCAVGASANAHVGVEIDTIGEYAGSIRYDITEPDWQGQAHRTVIERLPEQDSGDPVTFRNFLRWGAERYDADKRLVVLWNHGAGFRDPRRDIAYDDYGGSLDMPEVVSAFEQAGFNPKNKIAILGFDACLMAMLEVVNHMRDHVEFVVGSQETEPFDGWPYDRVLEKANADPTPAAFGKEIVDVYIKSYQEIGMGKVTQSAVDVAKTDAAVDALNALGRILADDMQTAMPIMRRARLEAQSYAMADYVDLVRLAELVVEHSNDDRITAAAHNVTDTAKSCVVHHDSFGPTVEESNGLSVWFPHSTGIYVNSRTKYLALRCNAPDSGWVRFLDAFHRL